MMDEALRAARQSRQPHPLLATLNNLVAVQIGMYHLMRDVAPAEQAQAPLQRALPHASEALALGGDAEPFYRCFLMGNLGEVLLHLGRLAEAEATLNEALALALRVSAQAQVHRMMATFAELDLARGRPEAAWERLHALLEEVTRSDVRMTRVRLHHTAWRCAKALGRTADALSHLEQYLLLERERGLSQLRAQSELFVTRAEAERARRESLRDQLTQLGNRREADLRWPQLLAQAEQQGAPLSVAMLDLDHFKRINDVFGHAVGDEVLVTMAQLLRENTRAADLVARIGGEEFLLVMPEAGIERAREVCERLRQRVADWDWERLAPGLQVTLSAGVTAAPPFDAAVLTARADTALYRAKDEGRDRVVVLR
jgi:diguanylate cyclase (GGDEF)-like protein